MRGHLSRRTVEIYVARLQETGEPTGATATGAQVYALIYGYVMSEAARRDAPQVGADVIIEEPEAL